MVQKFKSPEESAKELRELMENNTLSVLVDATQSLEYIVFDVNRRFSQQVKTLIKVMQEGVGYIAFNDESGFPEFHDYSLDYTNQIMAVRYNEDKELIEIMTDDNFDENIGMKVALAKAENKAYEQLCVNLKEYMRSINTVIEQCKDFFYKSANVIEHNGEYIKQF